MCICVGIMAQPRPQAYLFNTLISALAGRASPHTQLSVTMFTPVPGTQEHTGPSWANALAGRGWQVQQLDGETAPARYGQALLHMGSLDEACAFTLMLEDDAIAAGAWDVAAAEAVHKLAAADPQWRWLKLMMPDNYQGWNTDKLADTMGLAAGE